MLVLVLLAPQLGCGLPPLSLFENLGAIILLIYHLATLGVIFQNQRQAEIIRTLMLVKARVKLDRQRAVVQGQRALKRAKTDFIDLTVHWTAVFGTVRPPGRTMLAWLATTSSWILNARPCTIRAVTDFLLTPRDCYVWCGCGPADLRAIADINQNFDVPMIPVSKQDIMNPPVVQLYYFPSEEQYTIPAQHFDFDKFGCTYPSTYNAADQQFPPSVEQIPPMLPVTQPPPVNTAPPTLIGRVPIHA
ncbi:hypothetical protein DFH08DRAFT_804607 [Mycena albidolilacea]|uniref:Uncharacterized protein n=1 Tax=Mycena albidolilacea TaxID=1033008 RepID=A0AAD7EUL2_9AGAR|nr:hypothetical protein DFH08DRAFT_804607 [Mycena albidolilacea]